MELGHDTAMKIWERDYPGKTEAKDFRGRLMKKAAYGDRSSDFGWNIDHKIPKSKGGTDAMDNLQAVHITTNEEKGSGR